MDNTTGSRSIRRFCGAFLMLVTCQIAFVHSASATVYQLPGLRASDPTDYGPLFLNDVDIVWRNKKNDGGYLTAKDRIGYDFNFVLSGNTYAVTDGKYRLDAQFDDFGNFMNGSVEIYGTIADMGIYDGVQTLLASMSLVDFAYNDSLIGFDTGDLVCPVFDFCTAAESVYLAEFGGGFSTASKFWKSSGIAVTTVPVPAAAWLFGSALLGLAGLGRRRAAAA